jgi:hypothetical protein
MLILTRRGYLAKGKTFVKPANKGLEGAISHDPAMYQLPIESSILLKVSLGRMALFVSLSSVL